MKYSFASFLCLPQHLFQSSKVSSFACHAAGRRPAARAKQPRSLQNGPNASQQRRVRRARKFFSRERLSEGFFKKKEV